MTFRNRRQNTSDIWVSNVFPCLLETMARRKHIWVDEYGSIRSTYQGKNIKEKRKVGKQNAKEMGTPSFAWQQGKPRTWDTRGKHLSRSGLVSQDSRCTAGEQGWCLCSVRAGGMGLEAAAHWDCLLSMLEARCDSPATHIHSGKTEMNEDYFWKSRLREERPVRNGEGKGHHGMQFLRSTVFVHQ